jgi:hypothetical protein
LGRGSVNDISGIGYVTMELMHKDARYDGPITVRDVNRWPLESELVQFLLSTASAHSIEQLAEVGKRASFLIRPLIL